MLSVFQVELFLVFVSSLSEAVISQQAQTASSQTSALNYYEDPLMDALTESLKRIFKRYDRSLRPNHFGAPLQISASIHISETPRTSEVDMELSVDMVLHQSWIDPRLKLPHNVTPHDYLSFGHEFQQRIWTPDTMFVNEKHSNLHSATVPQLYFRLYPNGRIFSSSHLTVISNCPMNLVYFPMDYQICAIVLESYGYDEKRVTYEWSSATMPKFGANAFGLLQSYQVKSYRQSKALGQYTTGNFSSLICELLLARYVSYFMVQMYLPIALNVIISWFPFWMEGHANYERVGIGVTIILTTTSLVHSIRQSSPKMFYITAMDVYTQTSFLMVFVSLLESSIVCYLYKKQAHLAANPNVHPLTWLERNLNRVKEGHIVLDSICRKVLPAIFLLFNLVYWAYFLNVSATPNDPSWVQNINT
jgi:cation transporter family protein